MISKIHSAIPYGFDGKLVEVEGDMNRGLPAFNIVGMADKTINEARERVKSALLNSEFSFPDKRVTINLAPADLAKDGTFLDLAIALSVLVLSHQLRQADVEGRLFVGELSLNGELRSVRGVINIVECAIKAGMREIYVPIQNLAQAALVAGRTHRQADRAEAPEIYGVRTLQELFLQLKQQGTLCQPAGDFQGALTRSRTPSDATFDHVRGQELAKRALEVAVSGHHNILIAGPPGAGKTLLAKVAANLLPDLTPEEQIEVTKIHALVGPATDDVVTERPFRSPHHTSSATSIIGGGAFATPGEISLAHKGVLFLDELPEYPRSVLEALRQPLEDRQISISRANRKTTYPADFMLIATMNPCPCGYLGDPTHECKCTETQIQNYQRKLSGPLMDRIDMYIEVEKVKNESLVAPVASGDEHSVVKNTITEAVALQEARYGRAGVFNSSLSSFQVSQMLKLDAEAQKLLSQASERLNLSARSYFKTIKVAQTIADLEGAPIILAKHLAEALTYRKR